MKFLQAFASEENGSPSLTVSVLTLNLEKQTFSKEDTSYILPDKKTQLQKSADNLFTSPIPIDNINRQDYEKKVVAYFIDLNKTNLDYDKVNNTLQQELLSGDVFLNAIKQINDSIDKEVAKFDEQHAKDVEEWTKSASEDFLESLEEGYGHEDEDEEALNLPDVVFEVDSAIVETTDDTEASNLQTNVGLAGGRLQDIGYDSEQEKLNSTTNVGVSGSPADLPATNKPKALGKVPAFDLTGLSKQQAAAYSSDEGVTQAYFNGIGGGRLIEPVPQLDRSPGDAVLQSENNSGIIATRDEFYKLRGHTKSGAIYMFAGRSPENIKVEEQDDPDSVPKILTKTNDLVRDASYVYLSQKSDVDSLLGVAGGTYSKVISKVKTSSPTETRQGISLAAMKADDVVIMSRVSGIRLITGTDKKNSRGGEQTSKFGIDLIAGNDDSDLQPLVKGNNLIKYLETLSKSLGETNGVLADFINAQTKFNAAISSHTHYDPFSIFLSFMLSMGANPLQVNGGKNYPSLELMDAGRDALLNNTIQLYGSKVTGQNRVNNDTNAFNNIGAYKILSEKNRTN